MSSWKLTEPCKSDFSIKMLSFPSSLPVIYVDASSCIEAKQSVTMKILGKYSIQLLVMSYPNNNKYLLGKP